MSNHSSLSLSHGWQHQPIPADGREESAMKKQHAKEISAILAAGAEYWVAGEITARTGLIVSMAPRNNVNYDLIVNNYDMTKACRIEVKHSRSGFKANVSGHNYDFLVFVYAPSDVTESGIVPTSPKRVFIFPRHIVEATDSGKTGTNFNPRYVKNYESYEDKYSYIVRHIFDEAPDIEFPEPDLPSMKIFRICGDGLCLVATVDHEGFVAGKKRGKRFPGKLIGDIVKFGYWEECKGTEEFLSGMRKLNMPAK